MDAPTGLVLLSIRKYMKLYGVMFIVGVILMVLAILAMIIMYMTGMGGILPEGIK